MLFQTGCLGKVSDRVTEISCGSVSSRQSAWNGPERQYTWLWLAGPGEAMKENRGEACGRAVCPVNSSSLDYILIDKEDGSEQRLTT